MACAANLIPSPQARLQICCIPVFVEIPWFFGCTGNGLGSNIVTGVYVDGSTV